MSEVNTKIQNLIEDMELTYTVAFVPQSISRNATDKDPSLNWKFTLTLGNRSMIADYTQGIGNVPEYLYDRMYSKMPVDQKFLNDAQKAASVTGCYPDPRQSTDSVLFPRLLPLPEPTLYELLECMVADVSVLDYCGFEDWANNYGYDTLFLVINFTLILISSTLC